MRRVCLSVTHDFLLFQLRKKSWPFQKSHYSTAISSNRHRRGYGSGCGNFRVFLSDTGPESKIFETPNPDLDSLFIFGSSRGRRGLCKCHFSRKKHCWLSVASRVAGVQKSDSQFWKNFGPGFKTFWNRGGVGFRRCDSGRLWSTRMIEGNILHRRWQTMPLARFLTDSECQESVPVKKSHIAEMVRCIVGSVDCWKCRRFALCRCAVDNKQSGWVNCTKTANIFLLVQGARNCHQADLRCHLCWG